METNERLRMNVFPKVEKLCSTKSIDRLFASGESFIAYPLRVVFYLEAAEEGKSPACMMVSVSKKKFKRAVKRNRVKRLVREAYRLNKYDFIQLLENRGKRIDIAFLYLKNELPDYAEIEKAIKKAVKLLTFVRCSLSWAVSGRQPIARQNTV